MTSYPRLCILTGVPGVGKTETLRAIAPHLGSAWACIHSDDLIGPSFRIHGGPWDQIRPHHPKTLGWSAGWHLAEGRNALIEGCFRNRDEVQLLLTGVSEFRANPSPLEVVLLDDDPDTIAKRLAADPHREPRLTGLARLEALTRWVVAMKVDPRIVTLAVDCGGKSVDTVAAEVRHALKLP